MFTIKVTREPRPRSNKVYAVYYRIGQALYKAAWKTYGEAVEQAKDINGFAGVYDVHIREE